MTPYTGYVDQPGLYAAIAAQTPAYFVGTTLMVGDLATAQAVVAAYNPLGAVQQEAEAQVMATLAAKLAAGFVYNGVTIDISTQLQRSEIAEAANLAQAIQSGTSTQTWNSAREWPPMAGTGTTGVPIGTPQAMIDMAAPIGGLVMDLKLYAGALVGQIMAATSTSAVQTILSTASWPTS